MDGKKIDQLWHEAPEDREAPPGRGGAGGSSAGYDILAALIHTSTSSDTYARYVNVILD